MSLQKFNLYSIMPKFLDEETKKSIKKTVFDYGRKRMKVLEDMGMTLEEYKEKMTKIRQRPFDNFEPGY